MTYSIPYVIPHISLDLIPLLNYSRCKLSEVLSTSSTMAFNLSSMEQALAGLSSPKTPPNSPEKVFLVFFDTETTGLKASSEIIQIAAQCGDRLYNEYIIPIDGIPKFITGLTGFSITDGEMYNREGELLKAVSKQTAVENFLEFLSSIGEKVILVAHNCFRFDAPMLLTLLHEIGMIDKFQSIVLGFSDTLPLFREFLPERRQQGKDYKLASLATEFLGDCSGAHDAINDITMMQALVQHPDINIRASSFINSRKSVSLMLEGIKDRIKRLDIQREYRALKAEGNNRNQ